MGVVRSGVLAAGDLAVWAGLYAVGAIVLFAWLAGRSPEFTPCAFVFLCAQAGYLLDRVKVSRARMDPADALAQPGRFAFLGRHDRAVRAWILLELGGATVLGAWMHPVLGAVPVATGAAVWLYAGRPADCARPRPKDWPLVKGVFIAGAHTVLAGVVFIAARAGLGLDAAHLAEAALVLVLVVFADAVVCDLDDLNADRTFGTRSLPVEVGTGRSWGVVAVAYGGAVAMAALLRPPPDAALFATALILLTAPAALLGSRRDWIDARLLPLAMACLWLS